MRFAWGVVIVLAMAGSASPCLAQRGGPSPERFFRYLDNDGDGTIRGSEWDRIPRLRGMLEDMEIDPERGVKLEEFESLSGEMMQRMRDQGGFRGRGRRGDRGGDREDDRGGDERRDRGRFGRDSEESDSGRGRRDSGRRGSSRFGGSSRDSDSNDDGDSERRGFGRRRSNNGDSNDENRSSRGGRRQGRQDRNETNRSRRSSSRQDSGDEEKPRVTLTLPAEYASKDQNRDGQLGLYEWPQTDFSAFARLDHNGDGFLTPRELQRSDRPSSNVSAVSVAAPSARPSRTVAKPVSASSSDQDGSKYQKAAEFAFRALDRDKDGVVTAAEWKRSRSTRPLFEKGGVDISQTMSREDFIANYVRLRSQ
ncbi:EF hand [Symmachiella macrocystis]|uniref:EF hand n=1 Tax=Symmachiella macrocystis TaxID=2527985 RepID=A0A5C6B722_9PLAN|nr:EF-hand domain-containing protein [Symmachiella macrocystis]TWU07096.1 EF hand [Symmachiella macrocystis]